MRIARPFPEHSYGRAPDLKRRAFARFQSGFVGPPLSGAHWRARPFCSSALAPFVVLCHLSALRPLSLYAIFVVLVPPFCHFERSEESFPPSISPPPPLSHMISTGRSLPALRLPKKPKIVTVRSRFSARSLSYSLAGSKRIIRLLVQILKGRQGLAPCSVKHLPARRQRYGHQ